MLKERNYPKLHLIMKNQDMLKLIAIYLERQVKQTSTHRNSTKIYTKVTLIKSDKQETKTREHSNMKQFNHQHSKS